MNIRSWRRVHRYLGLVIGIQLFLWTLSGLVFSWNSIRDVRGDSRIREPQRVDLGTLDFVDLQEVLRNHFATEKVISVSLKMLVDRPVYELEIEANSQIRHELVDALSNTRLSPITPEMAAKIAKADFVPEAAVRSVERIDSASSHSEYRGKELPAFRVGLEHPSNTVIYVSANRGLVTARRNDQWRVFDFFWMLHTMDYQGRDNFNHWLLKTVSVFGLITVISGFVLGAGTSGLFRKKRRKVPADSSLTERR
jgi:uncharacterized iron-regulated membrane protein